MSQDVAMFNRAMEFAKNHRPSGGLSNLYVARTIDRDGNVTSETYGMNTMTDLGFEKFFTNEDSFPRKLFIGQGSTQGVSFLQTHVLIDPITSESDSESLRNTTIDYGYPMYYYPIPGDAAGNGLVTCVCKFQVSTFDYNITNISQAITITEYGIGSDYENLWTHSWVYDITGHKARITKNLNERLEITIYFCMTYYTSMITSGWQNNRYTVITTLQRFLGHRMGEYSVGTYKRGNSVASTTNSATGFTKNNTKEAIMNRQFTKFTNLLDFTMYKQAGVQQGYFDGFFNWSNGFVTIEPQLLSVGENFDFVMKNSYDNFTSTSLSDHFGEDGPTAPFTQADIRNVYLYDRFNASFSNAVPFTNPTNHWYCETTLQTALYAPIYYTNNDTIVGLYVYQNVRTDDPIIKFNNTDIQTIYATDSYWNRGSWELISNPMKVPVALQTKRYYITNTNERSLNPVRGSGLFTVTPTNAGVDETIGWTMPREQCASCDNIDRGYFVIDNTVYVPDENIKFVIGTGTGTTLPSGTTSNEHFCYGNIIVSFYDSSNYIVTNLDNLSEIYSTIKTSSGDDGFGSTATNLLTQGYRTQSNTGIICIQALNQNKSIAIDLTQRIAGAQNNFLRVPFDSYMACAIWSTGLNNTKRVAYISTDSTPKLKIYNFSIGADQYTMDLPSGVNSNITLMCALNNYVWITNGSTWCYRYDLTTQTYTACTNSMNLISSKSDLRYVNTTAVQDVILLYKYNDYNISHGYYFRTDENSVNPTAYNLSDYAVDTSNWNSRMTYTLKYVEDTTLALIISTGYRSSSSYTQGASRRVIDFGQYLNPPASADGPVVSVLSQVEHDRYCFHVYGENVVWMNKIIPIAYLLPTRLVGNTKTHSTINNIKHVSDKQWSVTVSNVAPAEYGETGFPPGDQN